jgi:hypothetical protein
MNVVKMHTIDKSKDDARRGNEVIEKDEKFLLVHVNNTICNITHKQEFTTFRL